MIQSLYSKAKVNAAYFLFRKPLPLVLLGNQRALEKKARQHFLEVRRQRFDMKEPRPYVAHLFGQNRCGRALVVHGWMSQAAHMTQIIQNLVDCGYQVVALDLPAHGESPGQMCPWEDSVRVIHDAQTRFGPFTVALGHSYGGAMILTAKGVSQVSRDFHEALNVEKMILMAAPVRLQAPINLFSKTARLNAYEKQLFQDKVLQASNIKLEQLDGYHIEKHYPTLTRYLCIHDRDDPIIPIHESLHLAQLEHRVTLIEKTNLGHLKVLYDKSVMNEMATWLAKGARP